MALYKGWETGIDKPRMIKAGTPASALRHMAKGRFRVEAITDPSESAELAASGIKIEDADAPAPAEPTFDEKQLSEEGVPEALAILKPLGFEVEVGGGGALFLRFENAKTGRQIQATATGGGQSLPKIGDFALGVYQANWDGEDPLLMLESGEVSGDLAEAVKVALNEASKKDAAKK